MKNMFNKANAPYLISSTLAIATLLASGVFAAAPYVGFLAPVAALSVGLPLIIGAAVFSAAVIALSAAIISKNKTISEKDAQLASQAEEVEGKDRTISEKDAQLASQAEEIEGKDRTISEKDAVMQAQEQKIAELKTRLNKKNTELFDKQELSSKKEINLDHLDLAASSSKQEQQAGKKIGLDLDLATSKDLSQLDVKISSPESQLVKNKGLGYEEVKGKATQDAKRVRDTMICTSTIALTLAPVIASAFIAPVSMSTPTAVLSEQQAHLCQINSNSTINLSPAHHVPTPQVVLENQINESSETLDNAFKSAKNNFGIPTNYSEPQWVKDLNKSETTEEIIDNGTLPNLFYESSNRDYQFAEPNITHAESSETVGSSQTAIAKYSDYQFAKPSITHAESSEIVGSNQTAIGKYSDPNTGLANYFMSTLGGFLKNLNPYEHFVSMVQEQVESGKTARHQGTLIDSVKLEQISYRTTSSV